jgi:hypothetical protein
MWPDEKYNYNDTFPLKEWEYEDFKLMGPNNPFPLLNKIYPNWRTKGEKPNVDHGSDYGMDYKFDLQPINEKPYIWTLFDNKSVKQHCSKSFDIIILNKTNITKWLPELDDYNYKIDDSIIPIMLLYKYGGIYIQPNVIVKKDLLIIFSKLKKYDFVKLDNLLLASRPNTILLGTVLQKQLESSEDELESTLEEFVNNENYEYYNKDNYKYIAL